MSVSIEQHRELLTAIAEYGDARAYLALAKQNFHSVTHGGDGDILLAGQMHADACYTSAQAERRLIDLIQSIVGQASQASWMAGRVALRDEQLVERVWRITERGL